MKRMMRFYGLPIRSRFVVCLLFLVLAAGCKTEAPPDPETSKEMIVHRNLGLAYLEEDNLQAAVDEFTALTRIAPAEPLGYANLGLSYLRLGNLEQAEAALKSGLGIAPDHADTRLLLAIVYENSDRLELAIKTLEESLKANPEHVRTLYQLSQYYLRTDNSTRRAEAIAHLVTVVNTLPANLAARLQLIELRLQSGQTDEALVHLELIQQILPELPEGAEDLLRSALDLTREGAAAAALPSARGFHNLLKATPFYQAAITEVKGIDAALSGSPVQRFASQVVVQSDGPRELPQTVSFADVTPEVWTSLPPSAKKNSMRFALGDYDSDGDEDLLLTSATTTGGQARLFRNEKGLFADVSNIPAIAASRIAGHAIFADYDNDGFLDIFCTVNSASRLLKNSREGGFEDVSAASGVAGIGGGTALFADFDLEGDLDIFIPAEAQNFLLRNNLDGTFSNISDEVGVEQADSPAGGVDAEFADFDDDGDIDLFVVNRQASNRLYDNLRQSYFREKTAEAGLVSDTGSRAAAVGDYNNDGFADIFITGSGSSGHRLMQNLGDGTFEADREFQQMFREAENFAGLDAVFCDVDNDGSLDLIVAGESAGGGLRLFYNRGNGTFSDGSSLLPVISDSVAQIGVLDYDSDGDLDILYMSVNGQPGLLRNDGGNINNYLIIRLAGVRTGSGKNNYFGIGARVEVKAGTLFQSKVMTATAAHFGIGNRDGADVVRVVWSNGVPQNRFNPERNQTILESQVLKGSCPWLFTWNGERYQFSTDILWTSALGMPLGIMGGEMGYAFPNAAEDYMKIPGERLVPEDGRYSLQMTSELWETTFVDRIKLLTVDHPADVDIVVDERFAPPPFPPFRIYRIAEKIAPLSAVDERANDLLEKIREQDERYVDNFRPGPFQGVTEMHDLVLDLGSRADADSVFLFLYGWVFPGDASINVNTAQSSAISSVAPLLQVVDSAGNWQTVLHPGFPKGKNKTVVADLSGKFLSGDRRVRIRTNMQIYWDQIYFATDVRAGAVRTTILDPSSADLHFRGFSSISRKTPYAPHTPDYESVSTDVKWRDLTGRYTRYGEVRPLLTSADNQLVVMNAGDEVTVDFDAKPAGDLSPGWVRDFLFYSNGWVKDGDLNTAFGQTVEPLPYQEMSSYPFGSNDAYPLNAETRAYLDTYQTREVTTDAFKRQVKDYRR